MTDEYPLDARGWANTDGAAAYVKSTRATLAIRRVKGSGPRYALQGARIYYSYAALDEWLLRRANIKSTSEVTTRKLASYRATEGKAV
jgi:hypothetical protein